jgi:hypothetical protein
MTLARQSIGGWHCCWKKFATLHSGLNRVQKFKNKFHEIQKNPKKNKNQKIKKKSKEITKKSSQKNPKKKKKTQIIENIKKIKKNQKLYFLALIQPNLRSFAGRYSNLAFRFSFFAHIGPLHILGAFFEAAANCMQQPPMPCSSLHIYYMQCNDDIYMLMIFECDFPHLGIYYSGHMPRIY